MPLRRLILSGFLFLFCSISYSTAGGWLQRPRGFYLKLSEWWVVSDQHFDGHGHIRPNIVEYGYYSTTLYAEYGIARKLTGILYFPFLNYNYFVLPTSLDRQAIWKTGDADIGLKYALTFEKQMSISASLILGLPLGYYQNEPLLTGDGEFNQVIRMDAGLGFKLLHSDGWFNFYTGYNHRANGFADELQYGVEGGMNISKDKVSILLRFDRVDALGDSIDISINPQSLFSNSKEYLSFSPEIGYHMSPSWGITIGAGMALSGKNIFASPSFTVGIFHKNSGEQRKRRSGG